MWLWRRLKHIVAHGVVGNVILTLLPQWFLRRYLLLILIAKTLADFLGSYTRGTCSTWYCFHIWEMLLRIAILLLQKKLLVLICYRKVIGNWHWHRSFVSNSRAETHHFVLTLSIIMEKGIKANRVTWLVFSGASPWNGEHATCILADVGAGTAAYLLKCILFNTRAFLIDLITGVTRFTWTQHLHWMFSWFGGLSNEILNILSLNSLWELNLVIRYKNVIVRQFPVNYHSCRIKDLARPIRAIISLIKRIRHGLLLIRFLLRLECSRLKPLRKQV